MSRISVSKTTTITNIGILNDMTTSGDIEFLVFTSPAEQLVLETPSEFLGPDSGQNDTWKISSDINLTLTAGSTYDIGYISDVSRNDTLYYASVSENGFTSGGGLSSVSNFASPQYGHMVFSPICGGGVRLYAVVPEPGTFSLLAAGALGLLGYGLRRRRAARRTAKPAATAQPDDPPILAFPSQPSAASAARRAA